MTQRHYGFEFDVAIPGMVSGTGTPRVWPALNSAADKFQEITIAIPETVTSNATYRVQMLPEVGHASWADFKTDATATQAELAEGVYKSIVASAIYDFFHVSYDPINFEIKLKGRKYGVNHTISQVAKAPEALPGSVLEFTVDQAAATSTPIPYGRFVVRTPEVDAPDEVGLPTASSGRIVKGVTQGSWFNQKDSFGSKAKIEYQPNDVMNVLTHSLQSDGIWVEADAEFDVDATVFIDCTRPQLLGALTELATGNMALPGRCKIVEGSQRINSIGKYCALVYVDV